jgi:hypothetical protein
MIEDNCCVGITRAIPSEIIHPFRLVTYITLYNCLLLRGFPAN